MKLEELLNVMDETEEIDIWVDKTEEIDHKTTKELFDTAEVSDVKNSLEYDMIKSFPVWSVGRTYDETIEIRIRILRNKYIYLFLFLL